MDHELRKLGTCSSYMMHGGKPGRIRMRARLSILVIGVLGLMVLDTTAEAAKKNRHQMRRTPRIVAVERAPTAGPRMIEVRPGLFISSWDCVTDEGYGRYRPGSGGSRDNGP